MNQEVGKISKWKRHKGIICALVLMVVSYVTNQIFWVVYSNDHSLARILYAHQNLTQGIWMLIGNTLSLMIIFFFTRARSVREFINQVGMNKPPTLLGLITALIFMGIGILALYGVAKAWIPPNHTFRSFYYQGGIAKLFFITYAVLIAPVCEEIVRRGFLYQAFRKSYNLIFSVFLILCVHAYFHWGTISRSLYTFACLVAVEILLCLLWERTGSLWNCILCHSFYNATQNLPFGLCVIILFLILPYFIFRSRMRRNKQPQ